MTEAPFQLFDPLDPVVEAALSESIQRFGVLVPVVVDQHGQVLDGHHRRRIADELDVEYRVDVVEVADEDEAREIARTLNSDRRHLSPEQRREVVLALREQGHSLRAIGGSLGVSKSQVKKDVDELSTSGQLTPPKRVKGRDGKSRPATKTTTTERESKSTSTSTESPGQRLIDKLDELNPGAAEDIRTAKVRADLSKALSELSRAALHFHHHHADIAATLAGDRLDGDLLAAQRSVESVLRDIEKIRNAATADVRHLRAVGGKQ